MQSISPLTAADFNERAKVPVSKFEIFIDPDWVNLCSLGGKNYLIEAHYSSGQQELNYEPIAADINVIIDDTDGDFHPQNTTGLYKDYFKVGRKIRFSTGFKVDSTDYLWQWFIGVISDINIDRPNRQLIVNGFDYTQYLTEVKLKSPNTYWGTSVTRSTVAGQAGYDTDAACKGVYIAYLDGAPIYDTDSWIYDQATKKLFFLPSKIPGNGTNNLIIYYYTSQAPENVIADLLVTAGLYANQAAALADMDYTATDETIDRVRFNAGVSAFYAIQKICERCDYHFYFKYGGTPVFKPIPSKATSLFDFFTDVISGFNYIENIDEVKNHIVIEGEEYTIYDELYRILAGSEIMYTLDAIDDGETYGKIPLTSISAGKIIVAGLDAGVTDRMFLDPTTKTNIEAWRHASDVTLIDGGDIYANSILLSKLEKNGLGSGNELNNGNFEDWTAGVDVAPDAWTLDGAGVAVAREGITIKLGSYSAKLTRNDANCGLYQSFHLEKGINYWKGRTVTFSCWVYATVANRARLQIYDGVGYAFSSYHTGDSTWQLLTVTQTLDANSTGVLVYLTVINGNTTAYFDGAMCVEGSYALPYADKIKNWGHPSNYTLIDGGDIYTGTVTLSKLSFVPFIIASDDLDDIAEGTNYGKVLKADISAGHILLSACTGNLDNIADGSSYGKVALTSISAGKIIVAGLDSGVTARMFADATTKTNIEAWRHASDVTLIDGGDIYANSITLNKLTTGLSPNLIKSKYSDFQSFNNGDTIGSLEFCTAVCDTSTFYIGDRCLKQTVTGATYGTVHLGISDINYNVRLKPSTKYILSYYAKSASGTPNIRGYIRQDDNAYKTDGQQTITTSWARYQFVINTDANLTNSGLVALAAYGTGNIIYYDAVQLEEASSAASPEASPYKPSGTVEIHGGQIEAATIAVGSLSFTPFIIASDDLDDIAEGTNYGKVLKADISAGHILLSACSGNLDNIADGSSYGKVALTSISAGKIIVAGLDSGVTARMFADATTKTNIEAWRHASDVTLIDGGDIYTKSITAVKLDIATITDNLILNPSFEQVGGWALIQFSGTATYSTADKTEGTYSLLLPAPEVGYGCRAIPLVPGDKYTVRVKLRGATATDVGLYLVMNEKNSYPSGDYVTAALRISYTAFVNNGAVPLAWTTYEFTYTVPAGVYWGSFCVYNSAGGPTGGIYIDEAEVRKQLGAVHIEDGVINAAKLKLTQSGNDEVLGIYQGASADQIFKIRSTSVDHQITSGEGLWGTDTDCFAFFRKLYPIFGAYDGGLHINSFTEDTAPISFQVYAVFGAASTAKDGSATGAINLAGLKADPTNHTYKACATNENIFCLRTKPPGGAYQAVFIVDCDGDVLYDGTASAFQAEDDIALVQELEDVLSDKIDRKKMKDKDISNKHKVVHVSEWKDEKGEGFSRFVSSKKLNLLLLGSIRQLNDKILTLESKVKSLEA